jgi:hypothetical protein
MVDVQPLLPHSAQGPQLAHRRVGTFQVLGPVPAPGGELVVHGPEPGFLRGGNWAVDGDQEVAVAVDVRIADRERPLQVRAGEVVPEDAAGALGQVLQDRVELRELRRPAASNSTRPGHAAI